MKIGIAYICVSKGRYSDEFAERFVASYKKFDPGTTHELLVIFNGGPPTPKLRSMFEGVTHGHHIRSNLGWDLGGFQEVSARWDVDLMICLGESVYAHRSGWLIPMFEAAKKYGPGMYGFFSSFLVNPHLNTTAFAVSPQYLRGWPVLIKTRQERYEFEHGTHSFWRGLQKLGRPTKLVTWDGCYDPEDWRKPPNILWRGDQSNCCVYANHVDRYHHSNDRIKKIWASGADGEPVPKEYQP